MLLHWLMSFAPLLVVLSYSVLVAPRYAGRLGAGRVAAGGALLLIAVAVLPGLLGAWSLPVLCAADALVIMWLVSGARRRTVAAPIAVGPRVVVTLTALGFAAAWLAQSLADWGPVLLTDSFHGGPLRLAAGGVLLVVGILTGLLAARGLSAAWGRSSVLTAGAFVVLDGVIALLIAPALGTGAAGQLFAWVGVLCGGLGLGVLLPQIMVVAGAAGGWVPVCVMAGAGIALVVQHPVISLLATKTAPGAPLSLFTIVLALAIIALSPVGDRVGTRAMS